MAASWCWWSGEIESVENLEFSMFCVFFFASKNYLAPLSVCECSLSTTTTTFWTIIFFNDTQTAARGVEADEKWHEIFHTKQFSPTFRSSLTHCSSRTDKPSGEWNFLIFITATPLTSTTTTSSSQNFSASQPGAGRERERAEDDSWEFVVSVNHEIFSTLVGH